MRERPRNSGNATRWCCVKSTKRFASVTHSSRSAMKRGFLLHRCRIRLSVQLYSEMSANELVLVREEREVLGDESRLLLHADTTLGASPSVGLGLRTRDSRTVW
jgi:hypothetical protein